MVDYLPSDEEFLNYIYSRERDDGYINAMATVFDEVDTQERFRLAVASGTWPPDDESGFQALIRETSSPDQMLRGRLVDVLKRAALEAVGKDRELVDRVPVGLLPTRELNACAIATPRGGAIILLDHGVIAQLVYLFRCATAFITWHSDTPFCRDASQEAYGKALIGLARFSTTGDLTHLSPHRDALRFTSLADYDDTTATFCFSMELFILLHEYGHVIRGHLSPGRVTPAFAGRSSYLYEYSKSEGDEIEADEYAIKTMLPSSGGLPHRPTDIAWIAGLVLKFFELCERVASPPNRAYQGTHPPARDRWQRIKEQTHLSEGSVALAASLDPAFEVLFQRAQSGAAR